ncbi:hypothetical protein QF000_000226 [Paraburkholderia atlantica]
MKLLGRMGLLLCLALASGTSIAGPARCSPGNQDSSCVGMITTAWQAPPTCPTDAGWTTVAAAQWIGSQYSAPQCNYQAPPICPAGYDQTGPDWNGSAWVNLRCNPRNPPPITIVSATGFYVWEDCGAWNGGNKSGSIPILLYKASWSDGSTTYYQYYNSQRYPVLPNSSGNYYLTQSGDTWPTAALFEADAVDPNYGAPAVPVYACSGFGH